MCIAVNVEPAEWYAGTALRPHMSRVRGSILSSMLALPLSSWVSSGISSSLRPSKNMLMGELVPLVKNDVYEYKWCNVIDSHLILAIFAPTVFPGSAADPLHL